MNKITEPRKGTIFLFILSSAIWFFIGQYNTNNLLGSLFGGIFLGGITTLVVTMFYAFMKATFKW